MPHFYFDVDANNHLSHDTQGDELADREAARQEALLVLTEAASRLRSGGEITIRVRDDTSRKIYQTTLSLTERWID